MCELYASKSDADLGFYNMVYAMLFAMICDVFHPTKGEGGGGCHADDFEHKQTIIVL